MRERTVGRERTEELERLTLSPWAARACESKGRETFEEPDLWRTGFQVDRDRILESRAFARLQGKSARFVGGDLLRTRLTFTLRVAQLARLIARSIRANEDLAEAVALAQDLGAAPFGDAGEEALQTVPGRPFGHQEQSLRVVERLERGGAGLNLTWEVRDGIVNHPWDGPPPATVEAQAARVARRIVDLVLALDDVVRGGVIAARDVAGLAEEWGASPAERQAALLADAVEASGDGSSVVFSTRADAALEELGSSLEEQLARLRPSHGDHIRALHCVTSLAVYYLENPAALPREHGGQEPHHVRVVDHLSSMTNRQVLRTFERVFVPSAE